ncbi:ribosomal protein L17 [Cantharellus anzutake]|uniref:ribosomal protein L17 n=1 Tax=Cantharellus anzutake TaxID=1750568 RepID=UPI001906E5C3|nr:ribosomal protein L17 [Cantharellus anzutake]KAF8338001.1 ribosomal protein L17 [Cantharellus anzutake]
MKHGVAFRKLSRTSSHRMLMLRNMVTSLLEHGQIKTTVAKAKETARLTEKMITLGKRGDNTAKRQAEAFLMNHSKTIPVLFDTYAKRYAQRPGGYTRIHKFGNRPGDNAPHAIIELVDGPHDIKFDLTARAVGRETVEQNIVNGDFTKRPPVRPELAHSSPLRPRTALNVFKVLRYRSEEDRRKFGERAAEWAVSAVRTNFWRSRT